MRIRVTTRKVAGKNRMVVVDERGEALPNQRSVIMDQRGERTMICVAMEIDDINVALAPEVSTERKASDGCSCGTSKVCEMHEAEYLDSR